MGVVLLVGCVLVAYSIPASILITIILIKPQLFVITVTSSLFWILSWLFTTCIWSLFTVLHSLPFSLLLLGTISQEAARIIFIRYYFVASRGFSVVGLHALQYPLTDLYSGISSGIGYGLMHISVLYASVFMYAGEYGAYFYDNCPAFSAFTLAAWNGCFFGIIQISLSIQMLDALRRRTPSRLILPLFTHLLAIAATMLNSINGGCWISLSMLLLITIFAVLNGRWIILQPDYASKKRL